MLCYFLEIEFRACLNVCDIDASCLGGLAALKKSGNSHLQLELEQISFILLDFLQEKRSLD